MRDEVKPLPLLIIDESEVEVNEEV